jgi:cobalt-zinc-cadmium efflux system protein
MHMNMGHPAHAPSGDRRALVASGLLTGVYFAVELAVGLWSGSVAVTSDAFHTFSAVGGVLIALVAQRLSERPASWEHTFGWGRAEILGALFNGLFLVVMAGYVFWMGAMRLRDPIELPTTLMLWTAAGGIVTELISFRLLYRRQKDNLNLKGAFWHIIQTFVGSLIIVVSALVIRFTGFLAIDPLLGMAFGLVLFWASWSILRSALRILLQSTPDGFDLKGAIAALRGIEGVTDVHHVHAWSLTSGRNLMSGHVCVQSIAADGASVLREASERLKQHFGVYFSTIQVEEECLSGEEEASEIDITKPTRPQPWSSAPDHRRHQTDTAGNPAVRLL